MIALRAHLGPRSGMRFFVLGPPLVIDALPAKTPTFAISPLAILQETPVRPY